MNEFLDLHGRRRAKVQAFALLHAAKEGFLIPNPWDAGSARLMESMGFQALASTSAGLAFSRGMPDNSVTREVLMAHLTELTAATKLPVNADLENGFGETAEDVAQTIRLAAEAGAAGGSIEDSYAGGSHPLYEKARATERVRAAVQAARSLPVPFLVTARAENYFVGVRDLGDTIARLQAYQDAGADVLFAPGLTTRQDIETVLREIDRPLNVLAGVPGMTLSVADLQQMGVRRISTGGSLARAAYGELLRAAEELQRHGTTGYLDRAVGAAWLNGKFREFQN